MKRVLSVLSEAEMLQLEQMIDGSEDEEDILNALQNFNEEFVNELQNMNPDAN